MMMIMMTMMMMAIAHDDECRLVMIIITMMIIADDVDEYDWLVELEEMIRTYSRLNNFQYDAVIALRPDTAMLRDIDLPKVGVVVDATL